MEREAAAAAALVCVWALIGAAPGCKRRSPEGRGAVKKVSRSTVGGDAGGPVPPHVKEMQQAGLKLIGSVVDGKVKAQLWALGRQEGSLRALWLVNALDGPGVAGGAGGGAVAGRLVHSGGEVEQYGFGVSDWIQYGGREIELPCGVWVFRQTFKTDVDPATAKSIVLKVKIAFEDDTERVHEFSVDDL